MASLMFKRVVSIIVICQFGGVSSFLVLPTSKKFVRPCYASESPTTSTTSRRGLLQMLGFSGFVGCTTAIILSLETETKKLRVPSNLAGLKAQPPGDFAPSQNELGLSQRAAARRWRDGTPPTIADAIAAAKVLEESKLALVDLDRWLVEHEPTEEALKAQLGQHSCLYRLGESATILVLAPELPKSFRDEVGWGWGLCGWRHCGPLADAEKALSTLEAQAGMLTVGEARFLVDMMRRSVDEARGACYLHGAPLWRPGEPFTVGGAYLTRAELSKVLPGSSNGDAYFGGGGNTANVVSGSNGERKQRPAGSSVNGDNDDDDWDGELAAIEAYEAEVLQRFQAERGASVEASVDDGWENESPSKAQRDLSLKLRLGL